MPHIVDPVTEPSVLREPSFLMDDLDFDALSSPLLQLQGKVDKNPQTAAIILAGGRQAAGGNCRQAHSHLVG